MELQIVDELGSAVGLLWRNQQRESEGRFHVAAPLSNTPLPIFEWVVAQAGTFNDWSNVDFVLMDEQVDGIQSPFKYIPSADPASYESFARRHLLEPLELVTGTVVPIVKPALENIERFQQQIDLLILAIGVDGNFANVMPGTPRETGWHMAELSPQFRQAHTNNVDAAYSGARFRNFGMSLGHQQVLEAGEVIVIASGVKKRPLVDRLLGMSAFDPTFPISIVHDAAVADRVSLVVTTDTLDMRDPHAQTQ